MDGDALDADVVQGDARRLDFPEEPPTPGDEQGLGSAWPCLGPGVVATWELVGAGEQEGARMFGRPQASPGRPRGFSLGSSERVRPR
eukprot:8433149-Alexandrium_andersonii.AAC.1